MRIHHVAFRTRDLARLERFYVEVLGLPVSARHGDRSVWLAAGEGVLMLERALENEPPVTATSKELIAFSIEPEERPDRESKLARAQVPIEARTTFTLYIRDPDGRRVGLSSYPRPLG